MKSRGVTFFLCIFFGWAGAHRMYVGKIGSGFVQLFTCGGFLLWWAVDLFAIIFGNFADSRGVPVGQSQSSVSMAPVEANLPQQAWTPPASGSNFRTAKPKSSLWSIAWMIAKIPLILLFGNPSKCRYCRANKPWNATVCPTCLRGQS